MNIYDKAHETARALKESESYQAYIQAKEDLKGDQKSWEMVCDIRRKQTKLQKDMMAGVEPDPERLKELEALMDIISGSPRILAFFKAEMEIIRVVEDIQRILIQAVDIDMGEFEN